MEELADTYPEEKDISTALDALRLLKKVNPKLIHSGFMEYIYPDFHEPVMNEDETTLISKAKGMLAGDHKEYAVAYIIFDRHWSTMTEANKKAIWNWCKIIVVLGKRVAGLP
ncbi:MAG: hypothetical protein WCO50_08585 [Synechococcus sp. ELA619]